MGPQASLSQLGWVFLRYPHRPMQTVPRSSFVTTPRPVLAHRGFDLRLRSHGSAYAFEIGHVDLTLHASDTDFRSAFAAERAARQFVDDALSAFDDASTSLAA